MKACEADAAKARGALRQERLDREKADAESRSTLHSLWEEWRMLQETNAQLHVNVTRLNKALEVTSQPVHCMLALVVLPLPYLVWYTPSCDAT